LKFPSTSSSNREDAEILGDIIRAAGFTTERVELSALLGDGSERRFFRIRQGASHFVALISPRQKLSGIDENDSYLLIGTHLHRCGVPVPRIYWADRARGAFLLEDLGDFHLQTYLNRGRVHSLPVYERVVCLLSSMQRQAYEGFETGYCFDTVQYDPGFVYRRELEYFRERFLNGYLGLEIGPDDLRRDFENIAEAAGDLTFSHVIHRDFQSRNIMITAQKLLIVDFQGMRFGPPAYDLASLLIDPYVQICQEIERKVVTLYWVKARGFLGGSFGRFLETFDTLRLCRNLQVLGAYGYLGLVRGKKHFLRYIPRAWGRLHASLSNFEERYPTLRRLVNRLQLIPRSSKRLSVP
jgi:N-acetylmuramate 1-kinase